MDYLIIVCLILLSALFSGLTLSLLSLDKNELKRKMALGNKEARKVYAVRRHGNLLLCTLLLGNVAVNSILAIFLNNITSGFVAGLLSTGLIVIFGEIIPQATFSRYALKIGARTAWIVKIFMFILYPFCFPIAFALDKALGEEMATIYSKKELIEIIKEHGESTGSEVDHDEHRIIKGALSFSDRRALEIMTKRPLVYALEMDTPLDKETLNQIKKEGFTRIPVYKKTIENIIGVLYVKDLIDVAQNMTVKEISKNNKLLIISKEERLDNLLNMFMKSKNHLAIVKSKNGHLEGVVSLEDVLEEIIEQEISDETD